jgi:tetratricopeptide (TPR) repeat protein
MLLKLQYRESVRHTTCAAFIRGSSPEGWLQELNRWGIALHHLECYPVPESIQSVSPAGLFVILKSEKEAERLDCVDSYGVVAGKLYVPVQSELWPAVSPEELTSLLLWDRQLFHPSIGLVGFSVADQLDFAELLADSWPKSTNWNLAHRGLPPKPRLQQIQVLQPTVEDVLESFKEAIEAKPLEEIFGKEEDKPSALAELINTLKRNLLRTTLSALQRLKETFSGGTGSSMRPGTTANATPASYNPQANTNAKSSSPGLLDRFEKWMRKNLADLEKKRNDEIQRLLKLFDENTDEALRYAIPLDSPYQNRGTAPPSAKLGPRSTSFNLGGLGGGGRVDAWNVDTYYHDLRSKYQRAAQKEIEAKNFKKAAYVYAHLLGDYGAAANVLEQGKHYREAAVLYKDHLKNIPAAAECLERGGLLLEAIELFDQLNKQEKVGDLYKQIGQTEHAELYYERSIQTVLNSDNYLDAARIIHDKLEQQERARQTLLKGWTDSNQSEICLRHYFDSLADTEGQQVSQQVEEVFAQYTSKQKRASFLNVLVYLNAKSEDPALLHTSRNVAYEIISEEVGEGNISNLHTLKTFLPGDRLIASDCSRFANSQRNRPKMQTPPPVFQLDKSMQWFRAVCHRNQFLVLGMKDSQLHLARGNWYGNFEYYSWSLRINPSDYFALVADPYYSNQIIICTSATYPLEEKCLPKNKYFDEELIVHCCYPNTLSDALAGVVLNPQGGYSKLVATRQSLTIHHHNFDGTLKKSINCSIESELLTNPVVHPSEVVYRNGFYYQYKGDFFIQISDQGFTKILNVGARITKLVTSLHATDLQIVLRTDKGCCLLKPEREDLNPGPGFFAQDAKPVDFQFISGSRLAVAEKYTIVIYRITDDRLTPTETDDRLTVLQTLRTQSAIVAILPTSNRNQCALLDEKGHISVFAIEAE